MLKKHHEKDERDLTIKQAENIPKWLKIVFVFFFLRKMPIHIFMPMNMEVTQEISATVQL